MRQNNNKCKRKRKTCGNSRGCQKRCASSKAITYSSTTQIVKQWNRYNSGVSYNSSVVQDALDFANSLARTVRKILGKSERQLPLKFAFYVNNNDIGSRCSKASSGPFVTDGGGAPLCALIEDAATTTSGLGPYLSNILGMTSTKQWDPEATENLGYFAYTNFMSYMEQQGADKVYSPYEPYPTIQDLGKGVWKNFYGMSGGGGSGAGFSIVCARRCCEETIVTGGGGGGAGMSSPGGGAAVQAGGGGGGGAQIKNATPELGAGIGAGGGETAQPTTSGTSVANWVKAIAQARRKIRKCGCSNIILRGGGGGGAGFEVYLPFDATDPNAQAEARTPPALSFGYGFQFALGRKARLAPSAGKGERVLVSCGTGTRCCIAQPSKCPKSRGSGSSSVDPTLFQCADKYARYICSRATYGPEQKKYGPSAYNQCICPVTAMYLTSMGQQKQFSWTSNAKNCKIDGDEGDVPYITADMIKENKASWCPASVPQGCDNLSACS